MNRKAMFLFLAVALVLILAGCAGPTPTAQVVKETAVVTKVVEKVVTATAEPSKPVELILWHMEARPHRVKAIQELADAFNASHPNIVVKPRVQSWGEAYIKTIGAVEAGKPPDMLFTIPDFTTSVKETGAVQPVEDVIAELQKSYTLYDSAVDPYVYDGHTWAVPLYGMSFVLWYRADLFEKAGLDPNKPPETWNEMIQYLDKLREAGVQYPYAIAGAIHMATDQAVYPLMVVSRAEHLFGEDPCEVTFNNPNTVRAYEMYKRLFDYSAPGSAAWKWDEPRQALFSGQTAMVIEKGHYLQGWEDNANAPSDVLRGAPIPIPEDGQHGTMYYSNAVMLLASGPEKREAFKEFILWLYQPENMAKLLHAAPGFFMPVYQEVAESDAFWDHPTIQKHKEKVQLLIDVSQNGKLFGFTRGTVNPLIGRISGQNLLAWTAQQMTVKGLSAEEAVALGAQKMEEAIADACQ